MSRLEETESGQIIIDLDPEHAIPHEGFNLSIGFTMTGFQGRKDNKKVSTDGPSPIPEESLPSDDQKQNSSNRK